MSRLGPYRPEWIKELRGENSDMKKVFGNLDDLGELRHQFEELFEEDFKSSSTDVAVDINLNDPAESKERREKTREAQGRGGHGGSAL